MIYMYSLCRSVCSRLLFHSFFNPIWPSIRCAGRKPPKQIAQRLVHADTFLWSVFRKTTQRASNKGWRGLKCGQDIHWCVAMIRVIMEIWSSLIGSTKYLKSKSILRSLIKLVVIAIKRFRKPIETFHQTLIISITNHFNRSPQLFSQTHSHIV